MITVEQIKMERRENILRGELTFPKIVLQHIQFDDLEIDYTNTINFWESLWESFLRESHLSTEVWMDKFENDNLFNGLLVLLSKYGWINSIVESNYGYIELRKDKILSFISEEELKEIRLIYKMKKYQMRSNDTFDKDNFVKSGKSIKQTGLVRKGFHKIKDYKFKYDLTYLNKYLVEIANNILKGMLESNKQVTYEEVTCALLGMMSGRNREEYTVERNYSDSRGRSIFQCQKRIGNPISSKDMRSIVKIPARTISIEDTAVINHIYGFIAELNDFKGIGLPYEEKINTGQNMYSQKVFNILPIKDTLHQYIWLERIYEKLDVLFEEGQVKWDIPIEIDATASVAQFIGVLTNNHVYLNKTNIIGDKIEDLWTIEGIDRNMVKKHFTRQIYGSTLTPKETLVDLNIPHTQEDINKLNKLAKEGIFMDACFFKDYIINNVKPKESMNINIYNDNFNIKCNKFQWDVTETKKYIVYTSNQGLAGTITRQLNLIPDLDRFRRFFVTLVIHNVDSQVANKVCNELNSWIIPNHDAFLVHPLDINKTKEIYKNSLFNIYKNRKEILKQYFKSIDIPYVNMDVNVEELEYEDFNSNTILK